MHPLTRLVEIAIYEREIALFPGRSPRSSR